IGCADGAPHGAIQPPQLALGAGIHVAHAADDAVRLIVQIEAVGHELLELDFGRTFRAAAVAAVEAVAAPVASIRPASSFARPAAFARGTGVASLFLFLWH